MKRNSLLKNIIYGFLSWFLPLGLSFIATPIIVRGLGIEQYGVYALVLGFISYSFTFNIGRAVIKYVSEFQATNRKEKISEIISATLLLNLIVGGTGMILLVFFSRWFVVNVLHIQENLQDEAIKAFYFASGIVFAAMLSQVFSSVIQAIHRFDIYSYITVFTTSLLAVGNIALVWFNQKIEMLLAWTFLLTMLSSLVFYLYARRLLPEFRLTVRFPKEIIRLVLKYSSAVIVTQVLANFMLLFERSWIAGKLGAEAVTYYVIPLNLGIYIHAFITSISIVLFPLSSETDALGDKIKLLRIYTKATKIVLMLAAFLCLTLINGRNFILYLWLGADFAHNSSDVLITHALTFGFLAVVIISFQIIEGVGLPKIPTFLTFGWLAVSVPLMILLIKDYGITGVGFARLAGVLILIPGILYIEKKVFGRILWKFWQSNLLMIGAAAIFASIVQILIFHNTPVKWTSFLGGAFLSSLVYAAVLLLTGFLSENEKQWLKSLYTRKAFKTV
ncbi:MAG: oligosaccharide flippase family protein [Pyrinomonadaceae bacterium]